MAFCGEDSLDQQFLSLLGAANTFTVEGGRLELGTGEGATMGFNNTARGGYQRPALSSVDINPGELGQRVAELLIDRLEGRSTDAQHFVVPTHLVERETTESLDPVLR